MNENDSNKESGAVARAAGEFLGNALGSFITLGVTAVSYTHLTLPTTPYV